MKRTDSKPVGIWIRVYTEDQARGGSPEHHERRARVYAESKSWQVKDINPSEAARTGGHCPNRGLKH